MKIWIKITKAFKTWIKRHVVDDAPEELEDEFSEKYRK
jgi:hypothetical protein